MRFLGRHQNRTFPAISRQKEMAQCIKRLGLCSCFMFVCFSNSSQQVYAQVKIYKHIMYGHISFYCFNISHFNWDPFLVLWVIIPLLILAKV